MNSHKINLIHDNPLKSKFQLRNLNLSQIWQPIPNNLNRENQQLRLLLDWVEKYDLLGVVSGAYGICDAIHPTLYALHFTNKKLNKVIINRVQPMNSKNIDTVLENNSLKSEFQLRNLDLSQIWQPTPNDLELENRQLRDLLEWVDKYQELGGSRKKMEAEGYLFPPISFDIDPDSDWLRFERWMAGKSIRGKLRDWLPKNYVIKKPDELTDDVIDEELEKLITALAKLHFAVDFIDELPPRLVYEQVIETLEDEFDLIADGWWHLDSCTGYCPDCVRRPWCEQGCSSCWDEDEAAGYMVVPETVKRFVSSSPVSLQILRICQEEEDRKMKKFREEGSGEMN